MSELFSQNNETLLKAWQEFNPNNEEYLAVDKVVQWAKQILITTNALPNFEQSLTDLKGLIGQYLYEVQKMDDNSTQNIQLKYSEAIQFMKWLTDSHEKQQNDNQNKPQDEQQRKKTQNQQQKSYLQENQEFKEQINIHNHKNIDENFNDVSAKQIKENLSKHQRVRENIKTQEHKIEDDEDEQRGNITSVQGKVQNLVKRYKQYLRIIFEHYCKISYATGQDPTFEQIMHKTTIMTINKFMVFCKDFEVLKLNPNINRAFLMELFKKNSLCYKEMSYEQFLDANKKLALFAFGQKDSRQIGNEQNQIGQELLSMLDFFQISSSKKFKQKMKRLNIQYRIGVNKPPVETKKVPLGYKFKFSSNNGKSEEQVMQQVQERKIHRSQRKLMLREKIANQNDISHSLNKKKQIEPKKEIKLLKIEQNNEREANSRSTQVIKKIISPALPPSRKISQYISPPSDTNNIQSIASKNDNSVNTNSYANIFKKQLGYAELHKIKNSEAFSKKSLTNHRNKDKNSFKLNSIVEEARIQVKENQGRVSSKGYSDNNISDSIATNSREQTQRNKIYDINKINRNFQLINEKIRKQKKIKQELNDLLGAENDQEDEFLKEHLQREKKNEAIGRRLSNRISELDSN